MMDGKALPTREKGADRPDTDRRNTVLDNICGIDDEDIVV